MSDLKISRDLALPLDLAGETIAILAKRGAGKTNTATVLVEELVAANVQTVIVDPVGAWWGIRSSAAGERGAGLAIPIIGGQHGDVELEQTAGQLIADVVVGSGQSMLLDLSDFPSKGAVNRFVTDFAERLYRRKARASSLLHLVLEEADEFAPQRGQADTARMRGAIEQIVRRGRSRGLGVTLITQRSAVLNKDVLTQADVLIVMRTTGPHDVKAIKEWVAAKGDEHGDTVIASLPSLETGEAWIWNPERSLLKQVKIRRRRTFDSSATPKAGETRAQPGDVAAIDISALGEQIQATVEKTKASDPAALKKRIRELELQVADLDVDREPAIVERIVEVPVFTDEERALLSLASSTMSDATLITANLLAAIDRLTEAEKLPRPPSPPRAAPAPKHSDSAGGSQGQRERQTGARAPARAPVVASTDGVSGPQQRILNALAALETIGVTSPAKIQVALFAEASPKSSSFTNNLGHLNNQLGLIRYPAPGQVQLTDEGRAIADAGGAPTTAEEVHAYVYGLVGGAKSRLLEQLIGVYPGWLTKQELADRAGASSTSSSFTNNLGSLRSLGLIDYPSPGMVAALEVLFP